MSLLGLRWRRVYFNSELGIEVRSCCLGGISLTFSEFEKLEEPGIVDQIPLEIPSRSPLSGTEP